MDILKKLFASRKWVTAFSVVIVDILIILKLPESVALTLVALLTGLAGTYIVGQSIVDATGNHESE